MRQSERYSDTQGVRKLRGEIQAGSPRKHEGLRVNPDVICAYRHPCIESSGSKNSISLEPASTAAGITSEPPVGGSLAR